MLLVFETRPIPELGESCVNLVAYDLSPQPPYRAIDVVQGDELMTFASMTLPAWRLTFRLLIIMLMEVLTQLDVLKTLSSLFQHPVYFALEIPIRGRNRSAPFPCRPPFPVLYIRR